MNYIKYCPSCGNELKKAVYGYLQKPKNQNIIHMGCMNFGDERDTSYICTICNTKYTENLSPIKLISCPLEASNTIFAHECKQYELLKSKNYYHLLDESEKICTLICPNINKEATIILSSGEKIIRKLTRTFKHSVDCPYNHLIIYKNSNTYINVPISDIEKIESSLT